MMRRRLLTACAVMALTSAPAWAQSGASSGQPGRARLRGTIDAVSAESLEVTLRGGSKVHVAVPANVRTTYVIPAKMSDIQPNSYIGTAAAPQPDGSLKALEVQVFPPSMRGVGEGHRPY